jgi:hypothetical protein
MPTLIQPNIVRNPGAWLVRQVRKILPNPDGSIAPKHLVGLHGDLKNITDHLNGNLSLGDGTQGSLMGNLNGQVFYLTLTGAVGVVFTLKHGLNRVPIGFIPFHSTLDGGNLPAIITSYNRTGWTDQAAYVVSGNASSGVVYFFLF